MRIKLLSFILLLSIVLAGCATPTAQVIIQTQPAQVIIQTQPAQVVVQTQPAQVVVQTQVVQVTPTPGANPEAVIPNVEANAQLTIWTFWLSPTFDDYIKATIARFEQTYPGVKVKWEDHQATFQDDLRNAFAAGTAPDVINLSVGEGWVSDFATQGKLLALDDKVPQAVKNLYFPGLWKMQLVKGVNYQFPYYQGMSVEVINTQIYSEKNGFKLADFPKTVEGLPALCKAIKEKTGKLCDIRMTTNDLLSQMVYEGNVKVLSDDGKSFTFNSKEAVDWLNMYVGMVKDGSVDKNALVTDQDRVGLDLFISGQAPFFQTGPNLIREIRSNNPALYGYLASLPAPVGKSGVLGKGLMGMSVNAASKFPNAAIALAQFMTNPKSMIEFSKKVAVYPGTPSSFDDPFFTQPSAAIEDSAKPLAKDTISKYADILPTIPNKAKVNDVVLKHIQQALFNGVDPQKALDAAVTEANALIK
jgi:ABC-type glycerol-3-phosphate transport system substrate-binding protein